MKTDVFKYASSYVASFLALFIAAGYAGSNTDTESISSLRLLGSASIPTGTMFNGVEFGGISGIDRSPDGSYWAISDDRGGERGTPRFYNLTISYNANGQVEVKLNRQAYMLRQDGTPFPSAARTVDPEAIRVSADGQLYWVSEGNWSDNEANRFQPFLRQMTTQGAFVREVPTPRIYDYVDNAKSGARSNKVFESLALAPDGTIYVANEDALIQDGPITTLQKGSVIR